MKLVVLEVPLLEDPKLDVALIITILREICESNIHFDPKWKNQTGNIDTLIPLMKDMASAQLFKSIRTCVTKVSLHTLTLTLNYPGIQTLANLNRNLFTTILNQLESIPSNRFFTDSVCFHNPKLRPMYSDTLDTWVNIFHLWIDIVKTGFGRPLCESTFDTNLSTSKLMIHTGH